MSPGTRGNIISSAVSRGASDMGTTSATPCLCHGSVGRRRCSTPEVDEEELEQSRPRALPKNLIARLPVQVLLTDGVPEAAHRKPLCAQELSAGDAKATTQLKKTVEGGRGGLASAVFNN